MDRITIYIPNTITILKGNPYSEKKNVCEICGKPAKNKYCSRNCSGIAANLRNHPVQKPL